MTNTQSIKNELALALGEALDGTLRERGFSRKGGTIYRRKSDDFGQGLEFHFQISRYPDDKSLCHLAPILFLNNPEINRLFEEINTVAELSAHSKTEIVRCNIGLVGPEEHFMSWRPKDALEMRQLLQGDLGRYCQDWVVPFLNDYSSLDALIAGYAKGDPRLPKGDAWQIKVAIAMHLRGLTREAFEALKRKLSAPGNFKRYEQVIDYFESRC